MEGMAPPTTIFQNTLEVKRSVKVGRYLSCSWDGCNQTQIGPAPQGSSPLFPVASWFSPPLDQSWRPAGHRPAPPDTAFRSTCTLFQYMIVQVSIALNCRVNATAPILSPHPPINLVLVEM